jgi:hypothetical protein
VKLHRNIFVATALALAVASTAFGSASGGSSARTIKATALGTGITFIDADRSGKPSIGDYEIGTNVFVNSAGKRLGHGSVFCVQVNAVGTQYQCQSQLHFAGGDIMTAGAFSATSPTYNSAIVGGTRAYAGVTGTMSGKWLDKNFAKARVVLTLSS